MLKPLLPTQWSAAHAAHLLNRAGFGGSPAEIAALHRLGLVGAVNKILSGDEEDDLFPPPQLSQPADLVQQRESAKNTADDAKKREMQQQYRRLQGQQIRALRVWWLNRMRYTTHPLREKMTLFWHGHFATSIDKVNVAYLMWQQNETLRAHSLGNFRELTRQVSKDPAMMRYLDTAKNEREKPNENFARELMELFTLGEGVRYTEDDIRESARAFTGYRIDRNTLTFHFARRFFDPGEKVFMGRKGPFDGDDIVDLITAQNECSEFIARKLWVFFATDDPAPALVQNLAARYRQVDYDTSAALREIFLSEDFYAPRTMRAQVKSPVQWIVQTARVLEAPLPAPAAVETSLAQMGQVLFAPPNVKGWDGGRSWISGATLLYRYNLAGYVVSGKAPAIEGLRKDAGAVEVPLEKIAPADLRSDPARLCDSISLRLLNAPLHAGERQKFLAFLQEQGPQVSEETIRDFLHLIMSTPEYQLT